MPRNRLDHAHRRRRIHALVDPRTAELLREIQSAAHGCWSIGAILDLAIQLSQVDLLGEAEDRQPIIVAGPRTAMSLGVADE
jgi:hypothetical protein